jgi:hypothetical protein
MLVNNGCKWILAVITMVLGAWFGYLNQVYAVTYGELNAQREEVGLPPLTGNKQIDFQMLVGECNMGIRYSCVLARQLRGTPYGNPPNERGSDWASRLAAREQCHRSCQSESHSCLSACPHDSTMIGSCAIRCMERGNLCINRCPR